MRPLLAALAILALSPAAGLAADRLISLTGEGEVAVVPNMATVSLGVESAAEDASRALNANSAATTRVISAVLDLGVAERDIQSANFSIRPVYKDAKRGAYGEDAGVAGYRVLNMVSVTVRDFDLVGRVLDEVVRKGANRINNVSFAIAAPERAAALEEARRRAVADATAKARLYAEAAGVTLGPIRSIGEAGGPEIGPRAEMRVAAAPAQAVPLQAGELAVRAEVAITWEISGGD